MLYLLLMFLYYIKLKACASYYFLLLSAPDYTLPQVSGRKMLQKSFNHRR